MKRDENKRQDGNPGWDFIGDLHGHATELEALLAGLGYEEAGGTYRHPERRRVVFLGDYIDRGPEIRRTLEMVRGMVEAGNALAILGNHEVNALRYHTLDAEGNPLRPHTHRNTRQHTATLDQFAGREVEWAGWLRWFATLPFALDLGGVRAVHAAWDDTAVRGLARMGVLTPERLAATRKGMGAESDWVQWVMNGPESEIAGETVKIVGDDRSEVRVQWWKRTTFATADEAIYPRIAIPPVPLARPCQMPGYAPDAPPVIFGHYATTPDQVLVAPNAACIDLGIGKGGTLAAYSWDGEPVIDVDKLRILGASARPTGIHHREHREHREVQLV